MCASPPHSARDPPLRAGRRAATGRPHASGGAVGMTAPPIPVAARGVFGDAAGRAEQYAGLLAGMGVERGVIGPNEVPRIWERHLMNSAVVAELVPRPCSLVDLGSGAGLPGIVLALLLPDVTVTLLEPMLRRGTFLAECVAAPGLGDAPACPPPAEELPPRL